MTCPALVSVYIDILTTCCGLHTRLSHSFQGTYVYCLSFFIKIQYRWDRRILLYLLYFCIRVSDGTKEVNMKINKINIAITFRTELTFLSFCVQYGCMILGYITMVLHVFTYTLQENRYLVLFIVRRAYHIRIRF